MNKYSGIPNLLEFKDKIIVSQDENATYFLDPIRKKNIVAQPEEFVRQLILQYFISENIFPKSRIAVEKKIIVDSIAKRFDILVFDKSGLPYLLVECKSFDIPISDAVLRQISVYNQKLKCPYLLVSNGKESLYCKVDFETEQISILNTKII
jgi:hypothetical protein